MILETHAAILTGFQPGTMTYSRKVPRAIKLGIGSIMGGGAF
jgi:hypothetical protein